MAARNQENLSEFSDMFTILIVEDDKAIIEMLSVSLQAKQYNILKASTGDSVKLLINLSIRFSYSSRLLYIHTGKCIQCIS
jgi:PleD family two-component response regulator